HIQIISGLYQQGFNITYPTVRFAHMNGYIGSSLGGVFVAYTDKNEMILRKARSWLMLYQMQFYPSSMSHISGLWEKAFQRAIERYPRDPHISITYIHSQTLAEELKRNADTLVPRFIIAFVILALFSVACNLSMLDGRLFIDWVVSKPSLAVLGVFNAGMGVATAIGGLSLIGFPYNDIVGVMPFLVVAVGTDNMFLMVASIRGTNRGHPWDLRIGECVSDAAISMFITALTDAFSFGIGTITTIPAVQIFCVYTCVALAVNFLYQISFFCGLLSLAVQWEAEGLHSVWLRPTVHKKFLDGAGVWTKLFWMGSRADSDVDRPQESSIANKFFRDWQEPQAEPTMRECFRFGTVLTQPAVRVLVVLWYFIYLAFAIYGWTQVREGLEPVNLLVEDSYAIPHYRVLEKYFWHHGPSVQIVVSNPPDLRSAEERVRMRHMVHAFANNKHAIGDESAQFWMFEMERYYRDVMKMNVTDDAYYGLAQHFINERSTDYWSEDVKWARLPDGNITVVAFRFLVGMRDISSSVEQQDATSTFREVASRYARYNVTTFMPLWLFTDQYALVVPNIVQDI
ncbi:Protein PTR-2, partial [Aphelenchoides avenae]